MGPCRACDSVQAYSTTMPQLGAVIERRATQGKGLASGDYVVGDEEHLLTVSSKAASGSGREVTASSSGHR